MNIRRKPSFPKYSLPNHQWLTADKVAPDADIIRHDEATGLVLVRDRSRKPWSWHFEAEPSPRQRKKSTATVAAAARTAIEALSWRIRHSKDGAAACELAALISDACDALWKHTRENPELFRHYARSRFTWPFKRSLRRGEFSEQEREIIDSIELGNDFTTEDLCAQTFRPEDDPLLKLGRDLVEAIEDARNGKATGMLATESRGLENLGKKSDHLRQWHEIAEMYLDDAYPDLAAVAEFRSLVPEKKRACDIRKSLKRAIRQRIKSLAP